MKTAMLKEYKGVKAEALYIVMIFDVETMSWIQAHIRGTLYVRDFKTSMSTVLDYKGIGVLAYMEKWHERVYEEVK